MALWAIGLIVAVSLIWIPASSRAADSAWPWASGLETVFGSVALAVETGGKPGGEPALVAETVELYACGEPGCETGPPLNLPLRKPLVPFAAPAAEQTAGLRHLALDLPPGRYRLAGASGVVPSLTGRPGFRLPLHYFFEVREGRSTYLGRLALTVMDRREQLMGMRGRRGRMVMARNLATGRDDLPVHVDLATLPEIDPVAIIRAHPGRHFNQFQTEPMTWAEK